MIKLGQIRTRRRGGWLVGSMISLGAAALVVGAWSAVEWTRSATRLASADQFVVEPRTFTVVLKEKGELKAARSTNITNEVEGRSTIIKLVPEGTPVKQGDLLVELASDEIENKIRQEELKEANAATEFEVARTQLEVQRDKNQSDIRKAELQIELKRLDLEKYEKGDWDQRLKDAQIAIDQATILLDRRKEDFEAAKELFAKKFITKTEYEEDEFNHQKAIWELEKAHKSMEVLRQYTHVADLRQKQADLDEAIKECERVKKNADAEEMQKLRSLEGKEKELKLTQDQLAKYREQREKCRIYAPAAGFVVYFGGEGGGRMWSNDQQIREGATVHERQVLLTLPDTTEMQVVVRVHEAKTNKLAQGQKARVTVEGLPGQLLEGTVTRIAALADTQNRWLNPDLKEYETEITLERTDAPLKPGVTAHTEILVEQVTERLAVPVQAVYAQGGRRYVFKEVRGASPEAIEVKTGALGSEFAEIREGLNQGDSVLLAFSDEHKRLIPEAPAPSREGAAAWSGGEGRPPVAAGSPPSRNGANAVRPENRQGRGPGQGDRSGSQTKPSGSSNSGR